jgi:hypothetical protein
VQVSGKYRPRLQEFEVELRRRLGDVGDVVAIDGAERSPRYTSADLYDFAYKRASQRRSGRIARNAIVLPISKSSEWWKKSSLERHTYFYPHTDAGTGCPVHGHAQAAQEGIATIFRRLYHNPDGYERTEIPSGSMSKRGLSGGAGEFSNGRERPSLSLVMTSHRGTEAQSSNSQRLTRRIPSLITSLLKFRIKPTRNPVTSRRPAPR